MNRQKSHCGFPSWLIFIMLLAPRSISRDNLCTGLMLWHKNDCKFTINYPHLQHHGKKNYNTGNCSFKKLSCWKTCRVMLIRSIALLCLTRLGSAGRWVCGVPNTCRVILTKTKTRNNTSSWDVMFNRKPKIVLWTPIFLYFPLGFTLVAILLRKHCCQILSKESKYWLF